MGLQDTGASGPERPMPHHKATLVLLQSDIGLPHPASHSYSGLLLLRSGTCHVLTILCTSFVALKSLKGHIWSPVPPLTASALSTIDLVCGSSQLLDMWCICKLQCIKLNKAWHLNPQMGPTSPHGKYLVKF